MKKGKHKRKKWVQILLTVVWGILVIISAFGFWIGVDLMGAAENAKDEIGDEQLHNEYGLLFDGLEQTDTLQYLNVIGMSEAFYPDMDSSDDFYFAEDEEHVYFVVSMLTIESMWNDILGSRDIYEDYFYGDTDELPEVTQMIGVPRRFDMEIKQEAIEHWNYIWDEEFFTEENFEDYFGTCYLYVLPFGAKTVSQLLFIGRACVFGNVIFILVLVLVFSILMTKRKTEIKVV